MRRTTTTPTGLSFHRHPDFRRYLSPDDELAHYSFDDPAHRGADVSKASDTDVDLTPGTEIVPGKVGDAIGISPSGDLPFDGAIDEVRIFGVAADQAMARSLAGLDGAPALAGLWVNGRPVAGLNPSVHHYDVVVPRGHLALVVAHASPGARVELPFRVSWLSDVESKPLTFTVRRGKLSQTYTMTVRRASGDTSLAGVETADGAARSFGVGTTSYHVAGLKNCTETCPSRAW